MGEILRKKLLQFQYQPPNSPFLLSIWCYYFRLDGRFRDIIAELLLCQELAVVCHCEVDLLFLFWLFYGIFNKFIIIHLKNTIQKEVFGNCHYTMSYSDLFKTRSC